MKRALVLGCMLSIALLLSGLVYAQKAGMKGGMAAPAENVNAKTHPNLAAAQRLCRQAFEKISAGQQANEWDMDGHAAKAKDLLDQASRELKEAAVTATKENKEHGK